MPEPAFLTALRGRPEEDAVQIVRYFDRLHALAATRFERSLSAEELQELLSLRTNLRNHLARWLEKR
jgi:hypothetical protein